MLHTKQKSRQSRELWISLCVCELSCSRTLTTTTVSQTSFTKIWWKLSAKIHLGLNDMRNETENNSKLAKTPPTLYRQMLSLKGKSTSGVRDTVSDDTNASAVCLHTNCYTYSFSHWKQLDLYYKNPLTWIINSETLLCFEIPSSWSLASIKGTTWLSIQAPASFRSER